MHSGRNTDGNIEYVVDHQGGGSNQSRHCAQVLTGHRIRSAAIGIGRNGLTIRGCHNDQEQKDDQADRQRQSQVSGAGRYQVDEDGFGGEGNRGDGI